MHTITLCGADHFICLDRAEANRVWKKRVDCRGKIWLAVEVKRAMLLDVGEVAEVVRRKAADHSFVFGG